VFQLFGVEAHRLPTDEAFENGNVMNGAAAE
jgi:hypothetical protein